MKEIRFKAWVARDGVMPYRKRGECRTHLFHRKPYWVETGQIFRSDDMDDTFLDLPVHGGLRPGAFPERVEVIIRPLRKGAK